MKRLFPLMILITLGGMGLLACDIGNNDDPTPIVTADVFGQQGAAAATQRAAQETRNAELQEALAAQTIAANPQLAQQTQVAATSTREFEQTATVQTFNTIESPVPITPTLTRTPIQPTATATDDPDAPFDIIGNSFYDTEWLNLPFEGYQFLDDNAAPIVETYYLRDFSDQVVLINMVTTNCEPCKEFQINIKGQAREFREQRADLRVVFISMNTDPVTPFADLVQWAEQLGINNFSTDNVTWIIANANQAFLQSAVANFGQDAVLAQNFPLLVADKQGRGHFSIGLLAKERIRDIVIYYNDSIGSSEREIRSIPE